MKNELHVKISTINIRLKSVRTFLNFCYKQSYMDKVEIILIKDHTTKIPYTDEEILRLLKFPDLDNCNIVQQFTRLRNWVITNYFLSTGNRLRTVSYIKTEDVDLKRKVVTLYETKNKEVIEFPLSDTIIMILTHYISIRKSLPGEYLFCSIKGTQLDKRAIAHALIKYNRKRGVLKTSTHLYRHRFAQDFCRSNRKY